jgi:hypothetical protein
MWFMERRWKEQNTSTAHHLLAQVVWDNNNIKLKAGKGKNAEYRHICWTNYLNREQSRQDRAGNA